MKLTKRMLVPLSIAFGISFLTFLNVYIQQLKDAKAKDEKIREREEAMKISAELIETQKRLQEKTEEIVDSTNKIVKLQDELLRANEAIVSLQTEMSKHITGGGAIPLLEFYQDTITKTV